MNSLSIEERSALRESVHRLLTDESSEAAVRATMETDAGYDPELWRKLGEMGVLGLVVDESHGGSGVGPMELEVVMEEVGAALLCSPLLASGVVAAELLRGLGDADLNEQLLPEIAAGTAIVTAAITGSSGSWTADGVTVSAEQIDGKWQLNGEASYVLHGQNANVLLVLANDGQGLTAFVVDMPALGVAVNPLQTFDHTLRMASITFEGVGARRVNAAMPVWAAVDQALDLALVALAGEQAGGAQKVLEFTVEYAKTRIQFGRQIGSFQAIKHMAADLLLETESAISAARDAARRLAEQSDKSSEAVSLAAFACADAFVKTAADGIQMHGGIAFTWEHPAHLYLKRARADAQLFGTPAYHRERYLQQLGA
ncbi:MAG: alkylation response protein AidB-like acyl-CoA dehydrogenase [Candidatus Azotimanducaceae bacterium]|jgi:alkylation response protein AidB-like acyl-CoA dehydrogenase